MKQHKEFQYIYKRGINQHSSNVVLFYFPQKETKKVGFTATKKIGNAVIRNRAKRRLRALFIEHSPNLKDGSYVFVAKQSLALAPFIKLQKDFVQVLKRSKAFSGSLDD